MKRTFSLLLILATIGSTLAIAMSTLNAVHPAFDLIANFKFHFALLTILLALFWLARRQFQIAGAIILFGVFALNSTLIGLPKFGKKQPAQTSTKVHSLLQFNVSFDNVDQSKVLKMILDQDPDIFVGLEFSSNWSDTLYRLQEKYSYVFHCPEWQNIGGGYIFSKYPFTKNPTYCHEFAALGVQEITIDQTPVSIGVVHLRWPWPASQPKQIIALKPYLNTLGHNALIAGDFNAATWSHAVKTIAKNGGLNIVENIGFTWMEKRLPNFLAKWIGLPIDNAMHKGAVQIVSANSLAPVGSDHLPVLIKFSIIK